MRWSWPDLMALPAHLYGPLVEWLDEQQHGGDASIDMDRWSGP